MTDNESNKHIESASQGLHTWKKIQTEMDATRKVLGELESKSLEIIRNAFDHLNSIRSNRLVEKFNVVICGKLYVLTASLITPIDAAYNTDAHIKFLGDKS